ncbi:MAG: GNAT family N-acetyltransferase, partial [Pseudomonadota bacterium]
MTLGPIVEGWTPREPVRHAVMEGRLVQLEPLDADAHGPVLHDTHRTLDPDGHIWTYLPYGPFTEWADYRALLLAQAASTDPLFFAIIDRASDEAV